MTGDEFQEFLLERMKKQMQETKERVENFIWGIRPSSND